MRKKLILFGVVTMLLITGCQSSGGDKRKTEKPTPTVTEAVTPSPTTAEATPKPTAEPTAEPTAVPSPSPTPDLSNIPEGYYVKWLLTEEFDGKNNAHVSYEYDESGKQTSVRRDFPGEGLSKTDIEYRYDGERLIKEETIHREQSDIITVNRDIYQNDKLIEHFGIERQEGQPDKVRNHQVYAFNSEGRLVKEVSMQNGEMEYMYLYSYSGGNLVRQDIFFLNGTDNYYLYKYDDKGNCIHEEFGLASDGDSPCYTCDSEYCEFGPIWSTLRDQEGELHHEYKYDENGNLIYESLQQGGSFSYSTFEYKDGHEVNSKHYGERGSLTEDYYWVYDGNLLIREYSLDAEGKEESFIAYTYDEYGNLIKQEVRRILLGDTWTSTWSYRPVVLPEQPEPVIGEEKAPRAFFSLRKGLGEYALQTIAPIDGAPEEPPAIGEWKAKRFMFVTGVNPYNYFVKQVDRPTHYATLTAKDGVVNADIYLSVGNGKYTLDKSAEYTISDDVEIIVFTKPELEGVEEAVWEVVQYQVNGDWETFNRMFGQSSLAEVWVKDGKIVRVAANTAK